jgi:ssDNA-binding replication factor A large subunit
MHKSKDQLYEEIKDLKTKKHFEEEITKIRKEHDDLLDDDTIALLISDELGRNKENICKICNLEHGKEYTVFGKIIEIKKSRKFNRHNGSQGRVINLELSDGTGTCGLALWDKDVELVEKHTIQRGTNVKIINGYVKDGFNGLEINVGRWGLIEINPDNTPTLVDEYKPAKDEITGKLIKKEPTKAFFRDNGEFGFVTNVKLETKGNIKQITLWDKKVKEIQNFKQGELINIKNLIVKEKNGKKEIHANSKTTIRRV